MFLEQLVNGHPGQYALIALGYTMVYGIIRLINFALVKFTCLEPSPKPSWSPSLM